jgi:hypothetical protein
MNLRKLFRNHRDRMASLLAKRAGLEYPTDEMFMESIMYAKSKIKVV